jgi:hypothetical protein
MNQSKTEPPPLEPLYFDAKAGSYWLESSPGNFLALSQKDAKLHLRVAGFRKEEYVGALNQLEHVFFTAQRERSVHYSGALAGHAVGAFITSDGRRILVTSQARTITAKAGSTEHFQRFVGELLGTEQVEILLAWMKCARETQKAGDFRPGQLLALAGPSGCGKSLLQALLGEWLGGRTAKPYRYMIGETAFNGDLAGAEHWCIEDENSSTDIRQRRKFGASLKEAVVNREISIHDKGHKAITLPTFRRTTLSVNDEPENLSILPPLDASILDKITLFRCQRAEVGHDRAKTWAQLSGELPALAAEVEAWKLRKQLKDPRYGVVSYQHPELVECLTSLSPEERLRNLIDEVVFDRRTEAWKGTAEELERDLRNSAFSFAVDKLLAYSSACGVYLARLQSRFPLRFTKEKTRTGSVWTIQLAED